jgi:hypothetical protein
LAGSSYIIIPLQDMRDSFTSGSLGGFVGQSNSFLNNCLNSQAYLNLASLQFKSQGLQQFQIVEVIYMLVTGDPNGAN